MKTSQIIAISSTTALVAVIAHFYSSITFAELFYFAFFSLCIVGFASLVVMLIIMCVMSFKEMIKS